MESFSKTSYLRNRRFPSAFHGVSERQPADRKPEEVDAGKVCVWRGRGQSRALEKAEKSHLLQGDLRIVAFPV